nr:hypothetical protein BaRGS_021053 [Batillaria attramentaria]
MFSHCLELFTDVEVLAFLLVVLHMGMGLGVQQGFLFLYLKQEFSASPILFGLCLFANASFEAPMLYASGKIITRLGAVTCLYIALVALSVRMLGYSLLVNPYHVLLIEPLHGLTFGLLWAAATTHASRIAPPDLSATIQGVRELRHLAAPAV